MVVTLNWRGAKIIPKQLKKELEHYQYVFNPSYVHFNNLNYLAVRVYDEAVKSIVSKLYIWDDNVDIKAISRQD